MASTSTLTSSPKSSAAAVSGPVALLGRLLFVLIFLMAAPNHFSSQAIGYAASQGVPMAQRVTPSVERDHVRRADAAGAQHGEHRHRSVHTLTVHDVPPVALPDHAGDAEIDDHL